MIKKGKGMACVLLLMVCLVPGITVLAETEKMEGLLPAGPVLVEGEGAESMANPEPMLVDKIQKYVADHVDPNIFASIHIEWVDGEPVIVLSVTKPLPPGQQKELEEMAGQDKLKIRIVDYSEKELMAKLEEIDMHAFEDQGVKIWSAGINVWENRVEVAIQPFNEQTAQLVYDKYGRDMIVVVEGHEIVPLDADRPVSHVSRLMDDQHSEQGPDSSQTMVPAVEEPSDPEQREASLSIEDASIEDTSFFKRIWQAVSSWVSRLFS